MKTFLMLVTTIVLSAVSAIAAQPKDQACNQYMNDAVSGKSADNRLSSGIVAFNVAYELNLNADQLKQLRAYFDKIIAQYPKQQDEIEKGFYFGCVTDLTAEDKSEARQQLKEQTGI